MFHEKNEFDIVIKNIIGSARTGDYGAAASNINQFLQLLQVQLSKGMISANGLSKISYSLETIIEMQKTNDWVAVADLLEYELIDLLAMEIS
jgi:hypothetical protein